MSADPDFATAPVPQDLAASQQEQAAEAARELLADFLSEDWAVGEMHALACIITGVVDGPDDVRRRALDALLDLLIDKLRHFRGRFDEAVKASYQFLPDGEGEEFEAARKLLSRFLLNGQGLGEMQGLARIVSAVVNDSRDERWEAMSGLCESLSGKIHGLIDRFEEANTAAHKVGVYGTQNMGGRA